MGSAPSGGVGGAVGINSYATGAPSGFTVSSIALFSPADRGITDLMHKWGAILTKAAVAITTDSVASPKIADASSNQLTYWTDNGAYYDFYAYEPNITSKGVPQDVLVALSETFKNGSYPGKPLPVKGFMLDAYWMYNVRANGNCKVNDSFASIPFLGRPRSRKNWVGCLSLFTTARSVG